MAYKNRHTMTLVDKATGRQLAHSGVIKVVAASGTARVDTSAGEDDSLSTAETVAFSNGKIEFHTAETVRSADIYWYSNEGYSGVVKNAKPGAVSSVFVDTAALNGVLLYPFNATDTGLTIASAVTTNVKLGNRAQYLSAGLAVNVITADSTETIDVGVASSGGVNDTDGIIAATALGTAGLIEVGTPGALMPHVGLGGSAAAAEKLTYTLTTGTDTAAGFIVIPYLLAQPSL